MLVAAFDPGESTGFALVEVHAGREGTGARWEVREAATLAYPTELFAHLEGLSPFLPDCVFVIEQYLLYGHLAKQQSWSKLVAVRAIGAIEYAIWRWRGGTAWFVGHYGEVIFQTASMAKQLVSNYMLRHQFGLWKGYDAHQRDALRHAMVYLLKEELIAWPD